MKGIIKWFCKNPVAPTLLTIIIFIGGIIGLNVMNKEIWPSVPLDVVSVTMIYPGAGPQEVEQQICIRIEEAVHSLDGIKKISSIAKQSICSVRVDAIAGWDTQQLMNEIKMEVDAINTFPSSAERATIKQEQFRVQVMGIAISGDVNQNDLKAYTEKIRAEIALLPSISSVELTSRRVPEMAIELSEDD